MPNKEVKAILKQVREAINNEKYSEAIEKCEKLLQDDPKNYMTLLFLGAAYQNIDKTQAVHYLRKAVECSPPAAPIAALQGLINCAPTEELPKIYEQLLELLPEKYADFYEKLCILAEKSTIVKDCFNIFKRETKKYEGERLQLALKCLSEIWVGFDEVVSAEDEALYKIALEAVIADTKHRVHQNVYKRYLKLLYKRKELAHCVRHACLMAEQYPNEIYAFEWICKIYCEHQQLSSEQDWRAELQKDIQDYAKALLQLNERSGLGMLVRAFDLYAQKEYVAARELIYCVEATQPNYPAAMELLARTQMSVDAYGLALQLWQKLGKTQGEDYAICISHAEENEQLQNAISALLAMEETPNIISALARCYFKLSQLEKLNSLDLSALDKAAYTMTPLDAIEFIKSSCDIDSFDALLLLGQLLLKVGDPLALNSLFKATRLQPHRAVCFFYLGQVYYANNDIVRARKCFEKTINLNPLCEEAVNILSAIYEQLGEEELNAALLLNTLRHMKSMNSRRVYFKLGLHYLRVNKWDDAIQSFRNAIKLDVKCMTYWASLGDAYCERGSYNSAIRVFQKILEMDATNIYAKLQTALIKTTIRMYPEAIEDFDKLLQEYHDYMPGMKGAAEAHMGLANNLRLEHRYGRSRDHLQLAVNHLQRVFLTTEYHEMVWLWRLTANVFLQCARMPKKLAYLQVSGKLAKRDTDTVVLLRNDLLNLATRFFTCALKLKQNTYLWYELALCCYYNGTLLHENAKTHLDLATRACKSAIKEQSDSWQNWNLLGVILMHKLNDHLPLAQHCFIQALNLDRKSFTTWTNLGALYLKLSDIQLANQAFQRAQQSRPIYPNAWIGQAMIAEAISEEEEALDLFRHCQQFAYHAESSLGYAHWVCKTLSDAMKCKQPHYKNAIENLHADTVALDAINWYVINEESDASVAALSMQGFLNERQKLYRPAMRAYLQASKNADPGAARDKIYTNLGYLYLKLNQPEDAINSFNKVAQATFKPIIGLAHAYHRARQHKESYALYNSVLKSVADSGDGKAAHILAVMAAMVYASQGAPDTKKILYQCVPLKNSPIEALYSLFALGILHQEHKLTEKIFDELKYYEHTEKNCAHIAYLTAQYYLAHGQPQNALTYLMRRVHMFPQSVNLRKVIANFLLERFPNIRRYELATSQMALSATVLLHRDKSKKSDSVEHSNSLLIASCALQSIDKFRSLMLIQKAIHLHPQSAEAWQMLHQVH